MYCSSTFEVKYLPKSLSLNFASRGYLGIEKNNAGLASFANHRRNYLLRTRKGAVTSLLMRNRA
ncbi:hypothetical protein THF1C08_290043 [Vibrio jasicida]|uniref:Uncharacterized protein n=1 Tax=Vibrio jasicida TaxID=766224 RepID=A0AAU9QMV6_9VIBR|nr:hypothetical protein THF1C08_290043 [Vibrio jasicida]CAH1594343.1 hypothetical protein THF1A12_280043 [Vibrio jasicida]